MKLGPNQEKWLAALESGEWKQGRGKLRSDDDNRFCCLGVGADVAKLEWVKTAHGHFAVLGEIGQAPQTLQDWLGLRDSLGSAVGLDICLTEMNDNGKSFKKIAKFVRGNAEAVFKESK